MPPTQTPNPPIEIHAHPALGDSLTPVLRRFLPHSLPLLRRIQFVHRSPHRTLLASFPPSAPPVPANCKPTPSRRPQTDDVANEAGSSQPFVVAFVDRSRSPETECWIFTSFELYAVGATNKRHGRDVDEQERVDGHRNARDGPLIHDGRIVRDEEEEEEEVAEAYLSALFDAISALPEPAHAKPDDRRILRVGAVHSSLVPLLASAGWLEWCSVPWQKWIFSSPFPTTLPFSSGYRHPTDPAADNLELPTGFQFGPVPSEALELVRQRSEIRRTVSTLANLPGVAVFKAPTATDNRPDTDPADRGQIVGWGFLGVDGSINALHVETPWRGRGLAKAVIRQLLHRGENRTWFEADDDGYAGHADVHGDNKASLAVCASLGARYGWDVHWVRVNLGAVKEGMDGLGGGQEEGPSHHESIHTL